MSTAREVVLRRRSCVMVWSFLAAVVAMVLSSCGGGAGGLVSTTTLTTWSPGATSTVVSLDGSAASSSVPRGDIPAREAMALLVTEAREWAQDALPLNLGALPRNAAITDGRCNCWSASFYSASEQEVYAFNYFQDAHTPEPQVGRALKPLFQGVAWQIADLLAAWSIDSPEAAKIASEHGLGAVRVMELSLRQTRPDVAPPPQVPESCDAYWRVEDTAGNEIYIDASDGEVLG